MNPQQPALPQPGPQVSLPPSTGSFSTLPSPKRSRYATLRLLAGLLAVLVVIATGANMVYSSVKEKQLNDKERSADIVALASGLEGYRLEYDSYPTLAQLNNREYMAEKMGDVGGEAFVDPSGHTIAASGTGYVYTATPTGCNNSVIYCTGYELHATLNNGTVISKKNQN